MARLKKIKEVKVESTIVTPTVLTVEKASVQPLTYEFSNGELNMLKGKINEIIENR